jgi:hypothetical protein
MIEKIGKYKILERVGRGGMGTVFKAHDPILNRLVALKVISGEVEVSDELKARFFREARACAKLNHPNIILVYDLGEDQDRLFIVMGRTQVAQARGLADQAARQREAEQLRAGIAQARALAEQADAKRLAPKPWTDASGKEADAQGALGRRDLAVAIQRFREARQEFQRAAAEAQQATEAAKHQAAAPPPRPSEPTQPRPPVSTTTPPADSQTGGGLLGAVKRAFGGKLQGVSGPVAWEVVGVKTDTLPAEVRWSYTLVLRETTGTAIQFERVVHPVARGADLRAQVTEERFRRRLEANAELRLARTEGLTHSSAPEVDAVREGVTVWRRLYGKDEKAKDVVIDIQFRL